MACFQNGFPIFPKFPLSSLRSLATMRIDGATLQDELGPFDACFPRLAALQLASLMNSHGT